MRSSRTAAPAFMLIPLVVAMCANLLLPELVTALKADNSHAMRTKGVDSNETAPSSNA